jgi:hypothetical protein
MQGFGAALSQPGAEPSVRLPPPREGQDQVSEIGKPPRRGGERWDDEVKVALIAVAIGIAKQNQRQNRTRPDERNQIAGQIQAAIRRQNGADLLGLENRAQMFDGLAVLDDISGASQDGEAVACIRSKVNNLGSHSSTPVESAVKE